MQSGTNLYKKSVAFWFPMALTLYSVQPSNQLIKLTFDKEKVKSNKCILYGKTAIANLHLASMLWI